MTHWDKRTFNYRVRAFEGIGFIQGEAVKLADVPWVNFTGEVKKALYKFVSNEESDYEGEEDEEDSYFKNTKTYQDEQPDPRHVEESYDYNAIGENELQRTKYQCEYCNCGYKSNESLSVHLNDVHTQTLGEIEGYDISASESSYHKKASEDDPDFDNDPDFLGNVKGQKSEPSQYTQSGMDHDDQERGDVDFDRLGEKRANESDSKSWWDGLNKDERDNYMQSYSAIQNKYPTTGGIYMDDYDQLDQGGQYFVNSLYKFNNDQPSELLGRKNSYLNEATDLFDDDEAEDHEDDKDETDELFESKANEFNQDEWWWKEVRWESGFDQDFLYCNHCGRDMYAPASYWEPLNSISDEKMSRFVPDHLLQHGIKAPQAGDDYERELTAGGYINESKPSKGLDYDRPLFPNEQSVKNKCDNCDGTGWDNKNVCRTCKGTGSESKANEFNIHGYDWDEKCPNCGSDDIEDTTGPGPASGYHCMSCDEYFDNMDLMEEPSNESRASEGLAEDVLYEWKNEYVLPLRDPALMGTSMTEYQVYYDGWKTFAMGKGLTQIDINELWDRANPLTTESRRRAREGQTDEEYLAMWEKARDNLQNGQLDEYEAFARKMDFTAWDGNDEHDVGVAVDHISRTIDDVKDDIRDGGYESKASEGNAKCPNCGGEGSYEFRSYGKQTCEWCKGTGKLSDQEMDDFQDNENKWNDIATMDNDTNLTTDSDIEKWGESKANEVEPKDYQDYITNHPDGYTSSCTDGNSHIPKDHGDTTCEKCGQSIWETSQGSGHWFTDADQVNWDDKVNGIDPATGDFRTYESKAKEIELPDSLRDPWGWDFDGYDKDGFHSGYPGFDNSDNYTHQQSGMHRDTGTYRDNDAMTKMDRHIDNANVSVLDYVRSNPNSSFNDIINGLGWSNGTTGHLHIEQEEREGKILWTGSGYVVGSLFESKASENIPQEGTPNGDWLWEHFFWKVSMDQDDIECKRCGFWVHPATVYAVEEDIMSVARDHMKVHGVGEANLEHQDGADLEQEIRDDLIEKEVGINAKTGKIMKEVPEYDTESKANEEIEYTGGDFCATCGTEFEDRGECKKCKNKWTKSEELFGQNDPDEILGGSWGTPEDTANDLYNMTSHDYSMEELMKLEDILDDKALKSGENPRRPFDDTSLDSWLRAQGVTNGDLIYDIHMKYGGGSGLL